MVELWTTAASTSLVGDGASVTLVEGSAFCISRRSGNMHLAFPEGLFYRDTRFVSEMRLIVNGHVPEPLAAQVNEPFSATFVLRDHPKAGRADSSVMIFRDRYIGRGMREDVAVHNFGEEATFCTIEFAIDCDFADLFEVKGGSFEKKGELGVSFEQNRLTFSYKRGSFRRATHIDFSVPPHFDEKSAIFEIIVPGRSSWAVSLEVSAEFDGHIVEPRHRSGRPVEAAMPAERLQSWRRNLPVTTADHEVFGGLLRKSAEDLASLRIFDPENPERAVLAAGAPWFMTLFGRDSLITSWMTMMIDPDLALGTLQTLARFQGREVNPVNEEEPGRILHEMRFGESASLALGGGRVYYGTADATPLFVMLLGELRRWGTRPADVDALIPAADKAIAWMQEFGDCDGDGYIEYQRPTDKGLQNQGWKDSWDAIRFADGTLAESPIAVCEVQGYAYAAFVARAHIASEDGDEVLAINLRERASTLKAQFNRDFWLDEHGWYALALDREKRPVDALASNMGHCLWTGIIDEERAEIIAEKLLSEQMWAGWGVRTLATSMSGFNPISYHNGSIWPHDNAIIVAGLMRYGLVEHAHRVMQGIVDVAPYFGNRLPELFAGLDRESYSFPVSYPTSCSPQAWAAATPLMFLRAMLRFEPDLRAGVVHLAPQVPNWIGNLRITGMPLADGHCSIEARGDQTIAVELPAGLAVVDTPRRPTS